METKIKIRNMNIEGYSDSIGELPYVVFDRPKITKPVEVDAPAMDWPYIVISGDITFPIAFLRKERDVNFAIDLDCLYVSFSLGEMVNDFIERMPHDDCEDIKESISELIEKMQSAIDVLNLELKKQMAEDKA